MPLEPAALATVLVLAGALWASARTAPFGIPLIVILMSWFFKYSFALLDHLAAGGRRMPVLSIEMIMGTMGEFRWLVPLLLVAVAFLATGAASALLGVMLAVIAGMALLAVLPAVLVVQGWTGNLSLSLDPRRWQATMRVLGADYGRLVACAAALGLLCIGAPVVSGHLPLLLRIALGLYAWLALVALTGGALRNHREQLATVLPLITSVLPIQTAEELAREREAWADAIYGCWRGGARGNAWQHVVERIDRSHQSLAELRWLLERTSQWDSRALSSQVARELVSRLLREDREGEALRLVRDQLLADPQFVPGSPAERAKLAALARRWGDGQLEKRLTRD